MCDASIAALSTPHYRAYLRQENMSSLQELDDVASSLAERHEALTKSSKWMGVSHKASVYRATLALATESANAAEHLPWKEYWDNSVCKRKNCGGRHPTNYHDDLGARDRPRNDERGRPCNSTECQVQNRGNQTPRSYSSSRRQQQNQRPGKYSSDKSNSRQPKFIDEGAKQRFKKKIYQAALEEFEPSSHDLFAHLAGDDDSDSQDFEDAMDKIDGDSGADETTEYLNAAIGLDMLLN